MTERLFVRLEGDPSPCGPESTAPAGTLCAGSIHPHLRGNLLYDLAKAAINRLAFGIAEELRPHGVASLAVSPG